MGRAQISHASSRLLEHGGQNQRAGAGGPTFFFYVGSVKVSHCFLLEGGMYINARDKRFSA